MRFVKPIDRELIFGLAGEHSLLISVEENVLSAAPVPEVARVLEGNQSPAAPSSAFGIPDRFIDHGDQTRLLAEIGLDREGIIRALAHANTPHSHPDERVAANQ